MRGLKIVPKPQKIEILEGYFEHVLIENVNFEAFLDDRIFKELKKINICIKKTESLDVPLIFELDKTLLKEQYKIQIKPKQIIVSASTLNGAFYSIKTLQQILKEEQIPCMEIDDYPDLELRGVMLDISRSKVPTLSTLKKLVDKFATLKINHLELYVEGFSFEYENFRKEIEINKELDKSWRSRESLVKAANDIFTRSMNDIPKDLVELKPQRDNGKNLSSPGHSSIPARQTYPDRPAYKPDRFPQPAPDRSFPAARPRLFWGHYKNPAAPTGRIILQSGY